MFAITLFFAAAEARLVATITPVREFIDFRLDNLELDLELTNFGQNEIHLFPWDTPLFGLEADLFKVIDVTAQEVNYGGLHVLRDIDLDETLDASNYLITIRPGETKSARVDLTGSYLIPIDGLVTISMKYGASDAVSNVIVVEVAHTERQESRWRSTHDSVAAGSKSFTSCSSSQQSTIRSALSTARGHSTRARNCVSSSSGPVSSCQTVYNTYYGAFSSSRHSHVRTCWNSLHNNLPHARFGCSTTRGCTAYVIGSDRTMTIHLCDSYFALSSSERAATLIHEQSHFLSSNGGCSTHDHAYGRGPSQRLAPATAITNADTYAYFGIDV
jgi:peptidyl-Lys metalloendopeptidase